MSFPQIDSGCTNLGCLCAGTVTPDPGVCPRNRRYRRVSITENAIPSFPPLRVPSYAIRYVNSNPGRRPLVVQKTAPLLIHTLFDMHKGQCPSGPLFKPRANQWKFRRNKNGRVDNSSQGGDCTSLYLLTCASIFVLVCDDELQAIFPHSLAALQLLRIFVSKATN